MAITLYATRLAVTACKGFERFQSQYAAACVATVPFQMLMGFSHGVVVTCPPFATTK